MEFEPGTCERWAWEYLTTDSLEHKLRPPPIPRVWSEARTPVRVDEPGRPRAFRSTDRKQRKTPGPEALKSPARRVEMLHTFLHHELQAAELMCRAALLFSDTPTAFRTGLLAIAMDEVRHMDLYAQRMRALGGEVGCEPVRDWFWARVPAAITPAAYVATMGLGFEGANLDHTARFSAWFRHAGDDATADVIERVGEEEIAHVHFAAHWFARFTQAPVEFDAWVGALPPPLSPMLMRGVSIERAPRVKAGQPEAFVDALAAWTPTPRGPQRA